MHNERKLTAPPANRSARPGPETIPTRNIFYLDAHSLTRHCVTCELARKLPEFNIVGHASVQELIASAESAFANASAVILYVRADRTGSLPGANTERSDVAFTLNTLEQMAPNLPRVLLSEAEVPEDIVKAFDRRVRGYLPTSLPIDQIAEAIRFIAAGGIFVPQSILRLHSRASLDPESCSASSDLCSMMSGFSPRQAEVLQMLWKGHSNKLIAYELQMCESTVKVHIRHIMKKLNANNRTQVVLRTRPWRLTGESSVGAMRAGDQACAWVEAAGASILDDHAANGFLRRSNDRRQEDGARRSSEPGG